MFSDLHSCAISILLWILIDSFSSVLNMDSCHGNAHGCCDGYFWDRNACVRCPTGYIAINCSEKCTYPSYGEDCQHECQCNETECHHSTGCMNISTDEYSTLNNKNDLGVDFSNKAQSPWSTNKIIALCTLVIFSISIVLCGVRFIVKMKNRITQNVSNLQNQTPNDPLYQEIPDGLILRNFREENRNFTCFTHVQSNVD